MVLGDRQEDRWEGGGRGDREQVTGHHTLDAAQGGVQVGRQPPQRHVDDRRVQERQRRSDHYHADHPAKLRIEPRPGGGPSVLADRHPVQRGWLLHESTFYDPDIPISELAARYLHDALSDPRPMRLLAWRGLAGDGEEPPDVTPGSEDLSGIRRRQQRGEIAADLDPATIRLALLGAIAAPVVLPQAAGKIFGTDPGSPGFEARYAAGLRQLLARLAPERP